jgi:aminomethyltransferase
VLVGFEMVDKGVPRQGYEVVHDDFGVGEVTTGMFSPTTGRYLGLAYVPRDISAPNTEIEILIRNKPKRARIVKRPFYVPAYRR